jgi:hypothetical protein
VNSLLHLIKETNLFTREWMNVEKYNKPVAAVLGMNKTDFHVIILQSTVYTWGHSCLQHWRLWVVSYTYRCFTSGKRTALSFKSYWARRSGHDDALLNCPVCKLLWVLPHEEVTRMWAARLLWHHHSRVCLCLVQCYTYDITYLERYTTIDSLGTPITSINGTSLSRSRARARARTHSTYCHIWLYTAHTCVPQYILLMHTVYKCVLFIVKHNVHVQPLGFWTRDKRFTVSKQTTKILLRY